MPRDFTARRDPELEAHVTRRVAMLYDAGPSAADDRPGHVRAASGLSAFKEFLVVVQDDANWLALIDASGIHALPLPAGPGGVRVFSGARGNRNDKFDLEACTTVPGENGHELIGFGSGSHVGREWILRVHEGASSFGAALRQTAVHERAGVAVAAEFVDATRFYESLRANEAFCGAGLNIEGAVAIEDRIMLFQRGNARAGRGRAPVDATAEVLWPALAAHLADPERIAPPALHDVTRYDLGTLDGVRLTFSDADRLGAGRILYSASAEGAERIAGSVLGVIEPDGSAHWTELTDQDGRPFRGKIEGLSRDLRDPRKVHFVIDDDDESMPSELFEATLGDAFFRA